MADGNRPLRDLYPIYCEICKLAIHGGDYRTTGIYRDPKNIPVSRYAHLDCLGEQKHAKAMIARPSSDTYFVRCVYCGEETHSSDFVCHQCKGRLNQDMRAEPNDEVKELLQRLSEAYKASTPVEYTAPSVQVATGGHSNGGKHTSEKGREIAEKTRETIALAVLKSDEGGSDFGHFVPTDESGVILMFGSVIKELGYKVARMSSSHYPDAVILSPDHHVLNAEMEFTSGNFIAHGHDPSVCDMVICWRKDRELPIPVLALERHYDQRNGTWDFSGAYRDA